jgi:DNA-binding transcriptional LysR family regulator
MSRSTKHQRERRGPVISRCERSHGVAGPTRWRGTVTTRCRTCWCARCFGETSGGRNTSPTAKGIGAAVRAGLGWGMSPDSLAASRPGDGSFVQVSETHLDVPLYWQRWKLDSPIVDRFTDAVGSAAASLRWHN